MHKKDYKKDKLKWYKFHILKKLFKTVINDYFNSLLLYTFQNFLTLKFIFKNEKDTNFTETIKYNLLKDNTQGNSKKQWLFITLFCFVFQHNLCQWVELFKFVEISRQKK